MKNFKNAFEDSQELCNIVNDADQIAQIGWLICFFGFHMFWIYFYSYIPVECTPKFGEG